MVIGRGRLPGNSVATWRICGPSRTAWGGPQDRDSVTVWLICRQASRDCWSRLEWTSRGSVQFKTVAMRARKPICAALEGVLSLRQYLCVQESPYVLHCMPLLTAGGGWSGHLEEVFSLRRYLCARESPYVLYCRPLLGAGVDI